MVEEFDETQVEEQEEPFISYKIVPNQKYYINRIDHKGYTFYSINVSKIIKRKTKIYCDKPIRFKKGVDLKDGTTIIIKKAFEDFYIKDRFTPVFYLVILDFEIVNEEIRTPVLMNQYQEELEERKKMMEELE